MRKKETFEELVINNKDRISRMCKAFMGNTADADDLFQEILIRIWNSLDSFRQESAINTWIYRIATNTALTFRKKMVLEKKRSVKSYSEYTNTIVESEITDKLENEIRLKKLYNAIAQLKEIDRLLISMLLEDISYSEISDITGMSTNNIGVKIMRAKDKLSKIIKKL